MSSVAKRNQKPTRNREDREEARFDLRFMFASLFANIIGERREEGQTLSSIAHDIGVDKSQLANWLGTEPNWQISSIADIASGLKLKLRIHAIDEKGICWSPSGITAPHVKMQLIHPASNFSKMHVVRMHPIDQPSDKKVQIRFTTPPPLQKSETTSRIRTVPSKSYEVTQ